MNQVWVKITFTLSGADPDEAAGALAYDWDATTEVGEASIQGTEISIWLKESDFSPEKAQSISQLITAQFPTASVSSPIVERQPSEDWLARWKESFTPLELGNKIVVIPSWWVKDVPEGRARIILDPGMAFGTGHHGTTSACVEFIERKTPPTLLDIGCGSGILSIVAAKMGAALTVGIDNDAEATPIAVENARRNMVNTLFATGEADCVDKQFHMVVANLFLGPLVANAARFYGLVAPGGELVASGMRLDQAPAALTAFETAGFILNEQVIKEGWVTMALRKSA
ncbi:MAG: 50S ribosomal protein L11 methyltransferase [Nitrospinae bacterium]|nr:50S ribosomal protein L11 methyltransferase [Nitrospinota bacterium]